LGQSFASRTALLAFLHEINDCSPGFWREIGTSVPLVFRPYLLRPAARWARAGLPGAALRLATPKSSRFGPVKSPEYEFENIA